MNTANTVLPIVEEELQVAQRRIVARSVRLQTVTDSSEEFVRLELTGEHVKVERVSIDSAI